MQCGVSREGGSKSLPCLAFRLEGLETHKAQVVSQDGRADLTCCLEMFGLQFPRCKI